MDRRASYLPRSNRTNRLDGSAPTHPNESPRNKDQSRLPPTTSHDANNSTEIKPGWVSLQGTQGTARLAKVSLTSDTLILQSLKPSAKPAEPQNPGVIHRSVEPHPETLMLRDRNRVFGHRLSTSSSASDTLGESRQANVPHGETKPLSVTAVSLEAIAHRILFDNTLNTLELWDSMALCAPIAGVVDFMELYFNLLVSRNLTDKVDHQLYQRVAQNVQMYCLAITRSPALITNTASLTAVLRVVSSLGVIDAQLAEQLKVDVAKAHEKAQTLMQSAFTSGTPANSPVLRADTQFKTTEAGRPSLDSIRSFDSKRGSPFTSHRLPKPGQSVFAAQSAMASALLEPGFTEILANQVAMFHRKLWKQWSPINDPALLFHWPHNSANWRLNPLVFDNLCPHFLTVLVNHHLLTTRLSISVRAKLVDRWITVAQRLRELGDGVGWIAIVCALFQTPVLRLDTLWDRVTCIGKIVSLEDLVDWGLEMFELHKRQTVPFLQKRALRAGSQQMGKLFAKEDGVPYFGDAIITDGIQGDLETTSRQLHRVRTVISGWTEYVRTIQDTAPPVNIKEDVHLQCLLTGWAQQPSRPSDVWPLSLLTEPRRLGHYLAHFRSQSLPLPGGGMLPALFTCVEPHFRLFPRQTLWQASLPKPSSNQHSQLRNQTDANQRARLLRRSSSFPPAGPPLTTGFRELDYGAREQLEHTASAHVLAKSVRDLLNVGTETIDGATDIVFKAFLSDDSDHRSSRTSSILESIQVSNRRSYIFTDKRLSTASAGSLGNYVSSNYPSATITPMKTREVVIKCASMERLVDALVLDASALGPRDLRLELDTYIATLLATFRSFCAPKELLRMLEVRVRSARRPLSQLLSPTTTNEPPMPHTASVSKGGSGSSSTGGSTALASLQGTVPHSVPNSGLPDFPSTVSLASVPSSTQTPAQSNLNSAPSATAVRVVSAVLSTLEHWTKTFFFDFVDDQAVMTAGRELLLALRAELAPENGYPDVVVTKNRSLTKMFLRQQYSFYQHKISPEPSWLSMVFEPVATSASTLPPLPSPNVDAVSTMLTELDTLVQDAFSRITMADWMKLFEVLEQQAVTPTGLYSYRTIPSTNEQDVHIQDVYSWLRTLRDPALNSNVMDKLPVPIVALMRLHAGLVTYFVTQIADPVLISSEERVTRMKTIHVMLGVLRARMQDLNMGNPSDDVDAQQNVPSFLEQAIIGAIMKPESRAYAASWLQAGQEIAKRFPVNINISSDADCHATDGMSAPNSKELYIPLIEGCETLPVTICIGWIIERLLEIVCCIPNLTVDHPDLINFDKRRYAFNLINNMAIGTAPLSPVTTPPESAVKFLCLLGEPARNIMVKNPVIDRKLHKDSLAKEKRQKSRVFTDVVAQEMEKARVETKMYDKLERATSVAQAQAQARAAAQAYPASAGNQSFYGLPLSQSSSSLYSRRISRLIPSISSADISSYLDSDNSTTSTAATSAATTGTTSHTAEGSVNLRKPSSSGHRKSRLGGFFKSVRPLSVLGSSAASLSSQNTSNHAHLHGSAAGHGSNVNSAGSANTSIPSSGGSSIMSSSVSQSFSAFSGSHGIYGNQSNNNSNPSLGNSVSSPSHAHTPPSSRDFYSQRNSSVSSINTFGEEIPDEPNSHAWIPDSSIDLRAQPAVTQYSADDWWTFAQIDITSINNVGFQSPSSIAITHRSGSKPETMVLRCENKDSAQEWCSVTQIIMERKLLASTKVFGVPLHIVTQRENTMVPTFLETLLSEIEYRGLEEVGVYRISGSLASVNAIKQWFDEGNTGVKANDARWSDINAVAGCVKLYLRELPQPLMTPELLPQFMSVVSGVNSVDLVAFKAVLNKLPIPNYETLKRISHHLRMVVDKSGENKMNIQNIAIVFSVNFLPPVAMAQMGSMQQLVTALVQNREFLFAK